MGQLQDTMYREYPLVVRDVTAAQYAVQSLNAPINPGISYRVDGATTYRWDGGAWVPQAVGTLRTWPAGTDVAAMAEGDLVVVVA